MPQVKIGTVISTKMAKTVVVKVTSQVKHPLYKKMIKKSKKFKAQDNTGVSTGQTVKIIQTRPISKGIHFKVMEVLK